jgi:hypothetical protein
MFRRSSRLATPAAMLTVAVGAMSLAATSASAAASKPFHIYFENWVLSGSVTVKKLNEPITLPVGSTFNGEAIVNLQTVEGPVVGNIFVPPWNATILGIGTAGLQLTQVGKLEGNLAAVPYFEWKTACPTLDEHVDICLTLNAPIKVNLSITAVGALGIDALPTTCQTAEPISFNLLDTLTLVETYSAGPHFKGTTTFPPFICHGLEAAAVEPLLDTLISGPDNAYSLAMTKPAT